MIAIDQSGRREALSAAANKQLVKQIYMDAANRSGTTFADNLADEVCWVVTGQYSWSRSFRGKDAVINGLSVGRGLQLTPKRDFMPRVGFAYSPGESGNMSIRGGFGIGYDVLYDNIGVLARPPQIGSTVDCPITCNQNAFLANGGIPFQNLSGTTVLDPATARASTASYLPNNIQYPYSESWNLGVQRTFASNYTAEVRYVGSRGVHLNVQNRLNVGTVVTPTNFLPTFTDYG